MIAVCLALALWGQQPDPAALNESALQLAQQQRFDEAERIWKQATGAAPGFFPAVFNLGFLYFSHSRYKEAEPVLERAAALHPGDFNVHYLLGSTLVNLDRREDGLREWRVALKVQPANFKLIEIMAVEYGKGRYFKEAADLARRVLELRPEDPNVYFVAIKACQDAGDPAAMDIARRAARKFPDSARANFEYAFHLQKSGHGGESVSYLKKAMAEDPNYEEPFFFYGDSLMTEERYEEAIGYLRTAIRIRPGYVMASVALGKALMELEKYPDAVKELEQAIRLSPEHPLPHLLLSQVHFRMGEQDRARQEKEISLRLRRKDPTMMEVPQGRPFPAKNP